MIPNFALSLSLEGLRLLHRGPDGWSRVGEVPLDSADLAGDLSRLRERARDLAPEGMRTKLLIPNDQIRYLALEGERGADEVATALEGATPYPVHELVIDYVIRDGRTHVAAVARETLDEAESFAREHALDPVGFAAVPSTDGFPGEPVFGAVSSLDAPIARDDAPVRESAVQPEVATASPAPEDQLMSDREAEPVCAALPEQVPSENMLPNETLVEDAEVMPEQGAPLPQPAPVDDLEPAAPLDPDAHVAAPIPAHSDDETQTAPAMPEDADEELFDTPAPRRPTPLPQAGAQVMPDLPMPAPDTDDAPEPVAETDTPPAPPRPAPPPATPSLPPQGAEPAASDAETDPALATRRVMPPAMPRPGAPPAAMPALPPAEADASEDAEATALAAGAALAAPVEPVRPASPPGSPRAANRFDRASERERMTVFGARRATPPGRSNRLALIAAFVALALLAALAGLWMRGDEQDPQAGLLRDTGAEIDTVTEAGPEAEAAGASEDGPTELAAVAAPLPDYDDYPAPTVTPGTTASPAEAERIYAATGVWLRAPRLPLTPRAEALGDPIPAETEPTRVAALVAAPRLAVAAPDGGLSAQLDPPPAGSVFDRDARGFIAATAEGTLTPQGLVIYAGPPPIVPPARPGTPIPVDVPEETPAALESPAGEDVTIVIPEIPARPQEEEVTEGLDLRTGPPPVVPPTRPGTVAPQQDAQDDGDSDTAEKATSVVSPGGIALDALRPEPRPQDGLVPEAEAETADIQEPLVAYAGPRPPPRPEGLAPDAQTQVDEAADAQASALAQAVGEAPEAPPVRATVADALASLMAGAPDPLANATASAVPTARRPDSRPRNFDRVVAQTRSRVATAAPAARAPASAPQAVSGASVAPDGPVPGSVASAATLDGAINLRDINLIGVYGKPGARRALVRLDNGRYLRVGIGDTLDGGQVSAIGDDVLNYVKRGRTLVLQIPD